MCYLDMGRSLSQLIRHSARTRQLSRISFIPSSFDASSMRDSALSMTRTAKKSGKLHTVLVVGLRERLERRQSSISNAGLLPATFPLSRDATFPTPPPFPSPPALLFYLPSWQTRRELRNLRPMLRLLDVDTRDGAHARPALARQISVK